MSKIFDVNSDVHESPNRNTFDLLHKRHMTGKAGVITPFLCMPVVPTDSFEIDTAIGANLMPMWYPTQSNMRFIVHYFFIPNRLMHSGWKNEIEGLDTENFPYMDVDASYYKTGSLADYLGVPTNVVIPSDYLISLTSCTNGTSDAKYVFRGFNYTRFSTIPSEQSTIYRPEILWRETQHGMYWKSNERVDITTVPANSSNDPISGQYLVPTGVLATQNRVHLLSPDKPYIRIPFIPSSTYQVAFRVSIVDMGKDFGGHDYDFPSNGQGITADSITWNRCNIDQKDVKIDFYFSLGVYNTATDTNWLQLPISDVEKYNAAVADCEYPILWVECAFAMELVSRAPSTPVVVTSLDLSNAGHYPSSNSLYVFRYNIPAGTTLELSENPSFSPYFRTGVNTTDAVMLSAFPFRAYEMTYNAYYRNWQGNQPYVIDGNTKYNQYLPTTDGGKDTNKYELHTRNWELDAYTSCLPSPQQGDAPIISVDSLGRMRIEDEDGTTSTLELRDLDGEQGVEVKNVDIANPEHARLAMRVASSGLTIADFRQGNALQRFLEQSLRSGYRYADFIFGHFGKSPSHQELDLPIFIGGYTQNIDVSKISNVSASGDAPLGEFAGVGASFGGSKHKVKHYFDDYGWLLGVMTLVPDAAYSQILPKPFTYKSRLDWYFPEFSQLGMQAIQYSEICPIQSHMAWMSDHTKLLTDTFGYQRPNHEYVWMPDTLHGLFRTSLAGSVINRRFGNRPVLGDDFLRIKPEDVNDIFSMIEKNDDIYIAQVVVDIKATRPIPRIVVPSLGR